MGFILTPISWILYTLLFIVDEIRLMVYSVYKRQWFQVTGKRKFKKALNVDILGNFFYGETLEWLFSKSGYKFGRFGETISSCLGKKFIEKTLNFHGLIWYYILYAIDFTKWKKQGHCISNIQTEAEINNYLNRE